MSFKNVVAFMRVKKKRLWAPSVGAESIVTDYVNAVLTNEKH